MRKLFAIIAVIIMSVGLFSMPVFAAGDACSEYTGPFKEEMCPHEGGNENALMETVGNVLKAVFGLVGVIAVVFVIIGGFKYATSQGDPNRVQQAKNTVMFSLIGLVVTLLAFTITHFVLIALGG